MKWIVTLVLGLGVLTLLCLGLAVVTPVILVRWTQPVQQPVVVQPPAIPPVIVSNPPAVQPVLVVPQSDEWPDLQCETTGEHSSFPTNTRTGRIEMHHLETIKSQGDKCFLIVPSGMQAKACFDGGAMKAEGVDVPIACSTRAFSGPIKLEWSFYGNESSGVALEVWRP